jgi:hypothetical protein
MKRLILVALALLISACAVPKAKTYESSLPKAKTYESSFGFSVDIPSHWLVLTRQEIKDNPDLFDFSNESFDNMNKDVLKVIMQKVQSGGVEIWFNTLTSDIQFADNINIGKTVGKIPKTKNDLPSFSELSSEYSKVYGMHINFYTCELREINGLNAMYLDYEVMGKEIRSLQCIIQKSNSVQIIITATCRKSTFDTIREEFNNIINSLRMN